MGASWELAGPGARHSSSPPGLSAPFARCQHLSALLHGAGALVALGAPRAEENLLLVLAFLPHRDGTKLQDTEAYL